MASDLNSISEWIGIGPHKVLESAPSAVVVVRSDGNIAYANLAAVTLFGYSRQEFVGKPVDFLIPETRRAPHAHNVAGWFKHPHARPMGTGLDIRGRNKNGEIMPLEIQLAPIETDSGVMALAWVREREETLESPPGIS